MVPTGCRIGRPHGTEKPVDRSRHNAGKGPTARILGAVVIERTRPHTAHGRFCLGPFEKSAQCAGRQLRVRVQNEYPRRAALLQSLVDCCGEAAVRVVHDDRGAPLPRVPTLSSDERLSTTTTRGEMPSWLVSESMQVGRSAALL